MIELLINGEIITGIDEIRLTKAVNDLGDLPSRQGEFSTTIDVPLTKSNCLALANVEQINNVTKLYNKLNTYELSESGVLVSNGTARILNVKDSIQVVLLSNNSDWTLNLESSLQDINLDDLNINFIGSEIEANRLNTSNFVFPNMWYDVTIPTSYTWGANDFRPSFYVGDLMKRILSQNGYTGQGDLFNDALFKKLVLPFTNKDWRKRNFGKESSWRPQIKNNIPIDPITNQTFLGGDIVYFYDNTLYNFFNGEWCLFTDGLYLIFEWFNNANKTLNYEIILNISSSQPAPLTAYLKAGRVDGFGNLVSVVTLSSQTFSAAGDYTFSGSFTSTELSTDNRVFFIEFSTALVGQLNCKGGEMHYEGVDAEIEQPLFQWTDFARALPDVKQSDIFITVMNMFNELSTTNNITREVLFFSLEKIIDNIPNAIDWSDKVDLKEEHEVSFDFFDNYFKNNLFGYKIDDNDPYIAGTKTGEGSILYDNDNLTNEGEVFVSELSPFVRVIMMGKEIAMIPKNGIDGELNPKIGYIEITNNNLITQSPFPAPTQSAELFFDDISFKKLIPAYYSSLQRILANNTVVKMLFRLTRNDFANFDFSTPIFIDVMTNKGQVRGHFYVNQISQYNVGAHDSCEVTLIQID